ncbi:hypothetical protein CRI93_07535 [Longimonas halophila]|uniref:LPS-assembly protein LptD central domain-containing protein n=2 Tax=Longimonas halophila TaxID=1469170 RepID=A0A2H3NLX9_9BACT|nr:hypothetical protein CRI93_07535 [Longimonas halophila]
MLVILLPGFMPETPAAPPDAASKEDPRPRSGMVVQIDTTEADTTETDNAATDTPQTALPDSTAAAQPESGLAPTAQAPATGADTTGGDGDLDAPIELAARDSLILAFDAEGAGETGTLHGEAKTTYQDSELRAQTIRYRFTDDELRATGPPSDTARIPFPVFEREGEDTFSGAELAYSLRTQRGRVVQARTGQGEASLRGGVIKRYEDRTTFVADGAYTTDNRPPGETPSYTLRSSRMKVVNERWVYTGPIQLYIFNIPMPLWLPFGMVPYTEGRRSGPLPPTPGEDRRGFFLSDFGWYFAMNEYTDFTIQGSVWSGGSFEINPSFRYSRTDYYNGDLNLNVLFERIGQPEDPDFQKSVEGDLRWTHNQDLNPTSSINGNVNLLTSSDFVRENTTDYNDAVRQDISSSINYSKSWPDGGRNISVRANQSQNLSSGNVSLTLPDVLFRQRSFKPFKRDRVGQDETWYERITTGYRGSLTNNFEYTPTDTTNIPWYEALASPSAYREGHSNPDRTNPFNVEMTHNIPLSTSFRINQYNLNIRPNISYDSEWVLRTQRKRLVVDTLDADSPGVGTPVETRVERRNEAGFAARHNFSTGVSMNTEFFGLFPVSVGSFRGLRHRVQPSLSYNYRPNFNDPFWGRTRSYVSDIDGTVQRYDIFTGRDVRGDATQQNLSFSVTNRFETKRVRTDSTGAEQETTIQLLRLNASSSYNLAADSLNLSDINLNASTSIGDYNVRVRSTLSPYQYADVSDPDDPESIAVVNQYMAARSPLTPVRLTRLSAALNGGFQGGSGGSRSADRSGAQTTSTSSPRGGARTRGGARIQGNASSNRNTGAASTQAATGANLGGSQGRVDFSIPWSLDFDLQYNMRRRFGEAEHDAEVSGQFSVQLTPKWRTSGRTSFDIGEMKIATTQLSAYRDLGAWEMSFSWVPFGRFQSYSFSLNVKGGQLRNLLRLNVPRNEAGSRLGGTAGRLLNSGGSSRGGGRPF